MFEQYAQVLQSDIPHLSVEGVTYPPPLFNQYLSNVLFVVRMALLLLLAAGPDALRYIGIENPPHIYIWAQENKVRDSLIPRSYAWFGSEICNNLAEIYFPVLFVSQVTAFLILFLLGGQIENQLLSTGAFEVYLNG